MDRSLLLLLDWAVRALSFFNTVALLWLGLTVLLNTERRTWGAWAGGGGLVLGGLVFAAHSSVVGRQFGTFDAELEFWWRASWLPFVGAPYLWYLVLAWYTGLLRVGRQRAWLLVVTLLGLAALALLVIANPLPPYQELVRDWPRPVSSLIGVPAVVLIYPVYSGLCVVLSLAALRRPEAPARFMGDLARRRARPWLVAASVALLAVSLAAGGAVAWVLFGGQGNVVSLAAPEARAVLLGFDLLISALVALVVVLVGQAVVAYEVFAGKALPRGGLRRLWQSTVALAAGYGALIGGSLALPIDPIYRLLLATLLLTLVYALVGWWSYLERERGMDRLRPFVASERLYERLLRPAPPDVDVATPFRALCDDVLGARVAYLAAVGPLAPLVGPPLRSPATAPELPGVAGLVAQLRSPRDLCVPISPARWGGAGWAVPLWSERGLIGVLLLGEKRDGGLYTQEEIEIARATGERLIDTKASAEMARRLMALQRQRLAESQVLDHRTRRALHDDVLPRLHTALLTLSGLAAGASGRVAAGAGSGRGGALARRGGRRAGDGAEADQRAPPAPRERLDEVVALLADVHRQIADLLRAMPPAVAPEVTRLGVIGALRQTVDGELAGHFDGVTWRIEPEAARAVERIPPLSAEVLFCAAREAVRNAARHGRNGDAARPLHLTVALARRNGLELAIEDDGVGVGATVGANGGSGQGLALHSTLMAVIGGTLTVESAPGQSTRVLLTLPE